MLLLQNSSSGASLQRYPHYCNIPYKGRVISLKTRSGPEIIGLILQAVEEEPLTRSKIMYQAMLNFMQVTDYTSLLIQQELLDYSKLDRKYIITDKGRQFLALFTETSKLLMATTTTPEDDGNGNNITGDNTLLQEQNQQLPPPQQHREVTIHK
jgi:predicted transcriptional regulator